MKSEFIWNHDKTALINVNHIVRIYLDPPLYEQKDYHVVCSVIMQGNSILLKGTKKECEAYLSEFHYHH